MVGGVLLLLVDGGGFGCGPAGVRGHVLVLRVQVGVVGVHVDAQRVAGYPWPHRSAHPGSVFDLVLDDRHCRVDGDVGCGHAHHQVGFRL